MFNNGFGQQQTLNQVQNRLIALRKALSDIQELYGWSAGVAASDLVTLGFSSSDASAILSAINDANAISQIYLTGQAPSTYPQVTGPYVYANSQRQVIGPQ